MHDIIIIGGGPAGYTAALYSARSKLDTLIFEKTFSGGQMATTEAMENYPGFEEPVNGADLAQRMENQAKKFGAAVFNDDVIELDIGNKTKVVKTSGQSYETKAVILCMGANPKVLGLPKEDTFRGAGVSYCAVCDGAFFKDKVVAVVGGGNTAAEDALYLAKFCPKVYLIHRRDTLKATKVLQEELAKNEKVEFIWDSAVEEIIGESAVEGIKIKNLKTDQLSTLRIAGLFIAIGLTPNTSLVEGKVPLSDEKYIITDDKMQTSIPGVFAAGDIREKYLRQVITAAADGACASHIAENYITTLQN